MISLYCWRITKYDPINRDKNGLYQKYEWASVGDVGKKYDGIEFTFETYLTYESKYIGAINGFLHGNNVESIRIKPLEKKRYTSYADFIEPLSKEYFRSLKSNTMITTQDIPRVVRFVLRELIWCKLVCEQMYVHFGYDYYMYIGSENRLENEIDTIKKSGMYVESMASPYL